MAKQLNPILTALSEAYASLLPSKDKALTVSISQESDTEFIVTVSGSAQVTTNAYKKIVDGPALTLDNIHLHQTSVSALQEGKAEKEGEAASKSFTIHHVLTTY